MHARVATFDRLDASRLDDLARTIRGGFEQGEELADARGIVLMVDRGSGRMVAVTLFPTTEAIAAAEPALERIGPDHPEQRLSVEVFEVPFHEIAAGARAARVSTYAGNPERLDEGIRYVEETILPEARGNLPGWKGVLWLADRTRGAAASISLWESVEALRASDAFADELRARKAEHAGERIVDVERFEVALALERAVAPAG
jgi:hypothetical protein